MNPLKYPILTDENIHPKIIVELRAQGKDVLAVADVGLAGCSDSDVIRCALDSGRVVLTHDSDFGQLVVKSGATSPGIIYLRPGQAEPAIVLASLRAIEETVVDTKYPFIIVAEHRGHRVRIRLRQP